MAAESRIPILVIGGTGRLGAAIVRRSLVHPGVQTVGTVTRSLETPFSGVPHFTDLSLALKTVNPKVVLDVAPADDLDRRLKTLCAFSGACVIGTTGYETPPHQRMEILAQERALVLAANFSPGAVALEEALRAIRPVVLSPVWETVILDRHHRHKIDRPSGTAKRLAGVLEDESSPCEIISIRQGEVLGEHQILFAGPGEELNLMHRATDRSVFADGALLAVQFAAQAPPGLWSMRDVLGLSPAQDR